MQINGFISVSESYTQKTLVERLAFFASQNQYVYASPATAASALASVILTVPRVRLTMFSLWK